jgi:hypothetical protein
MASRPTLTPAVRSVFDLARRDRAAATRELEGLALDAQVALVCDAPIARRAELIELMPFPEHVIPEMPEAELCFTAKALGLADASWLLEYATPEQIVACVDLDGWSGFEPDRATIGEWVDALAATNPRTFLQSMRALDAETIVLYLRDRIAVVQKPDEKEGWDPPAGSQTIEGAFYYVALDDNDDLASISKLLRELFAHDYWTYFRMMQAATWELDSDNEEWALRWRTGRLQDLGFPPWDEAMSIYRFVDESQWAAIPESARPLSIGEWHLPQWIPNLPAAADSQHLVFRTIPLLEDDERRSAFYAFIAIANKVAVADKMKLGDAEFTPRAIDKAARFLSAGLEYIADAHGTPAVEILRRVPMERLFRVGANMNRDQARS